MTYEMKVSRANPGLILLVLDDSGSMRDDLPGTTDQKHQWVARYLGIILKLLLIRSTETTRQPIVVKPRYYVHTILYGSRPQLWGAEEMGIENAVELYTQNGNSIGLSGSLGGTDSNAAMEMAYAYLQRAVTSERFKMSFPPMVFHLTDGESQSDASAVSEQIKQLQTTDGNTLVLNAYIGTRTSLNYTAPEDFTGYTETGEAGPSHDNIRLFQMSSEMPESIRHYLAEKEIFPKIRHGSRLFFDVRTKEMLQHVIQVVGSIESRPNR